MVTLRMGFIQKHRTQRLTQLRRGHLIVYVKREVLRLPFVIHPYFFDLASDLAVHAGVDLENPLDFYIDSNLSEFPVYQSDRRADKGRFGFALGVRTERLARLVEILERGSVIQTEAGETRAIGTPEEPLTEQERLVAARIGQGDFRTALLARWKVCPVTNVDHNELLRASHIKPWAVATPRERLDPFNGLLLSAHIDALFDRGLISFTDDGALLISKLLSSENISRLGLNAEARLDGLGDRHAPYLAFHRKDVFRQ